MATITLRNLPEGLHRLLKERAVRHRRSLNSEIIATLETTLRAEPIDSEAFLARIRQLRPQGSAALRQGDLDSFRAQERP